MRNDTALGASYSFDLFNGVRLTLWDAPSCVRFPLNAAGPSDAFVVSYCRMGALALGADGARPVGVRAGDALLVTPAHGAPMAEAAERTRGVAIAIAPGAVDVAGGRNAFGLDLAALVAKASAAADPMVMRTDAVPSRVCFDLEAMRANSEPEGLLRLKAIEILILMQGIVVDGRHRANARTSAALHRERIAFGTEALMKRDMSKTMTISELAQAVGVSPTVLKEAFKETFGMPVYAWYRDFRMQCACEMLVDRPQSSIGEIAAEVGYSNPSKFSKAFAECVGATPRAWRSAQSRPSDN